MLASSKLFTAAPDEQESETCERFAIYYMPDPSSELGKFGETWFGASLKDQTGICSDFGMDYSTIHRIAAKPARYGLHATLKAPFHLAEGRTVEQLQEMAGKFASNRRKFDLGRLKPAWFGKSLVLVPEIPSCRINQFASQCVLGFEDFRAPLTVKERTRRLAHNLNLHQRLMLEELGYPYVLSEFQFHITLTDDLSDEDRNEFLLRIMPEIERICSRTCTIDNITLVGDPGNNASFKIIERFDLA